MSILRTTERRERHRPPRETRKASDLTPEEHGHAKTALRVLSRRMGSWKALAAAMKVSPITLEHSAGKRGRPSAGMVLRAARLAGVHLEEILSGEWPKPGACPMCGRSGGA